MAFLGGLDLTKGRWDTPEHRLWKGLGSNWGEEDFYEIRTKDNTVT